MLTTKDILELHNAGLSDDLIDKLQTMGKETSKTDPNKKEQPKGKEQPTASDILNGLLTGAKPEDKDE